MGSNGAKSPAISGNDEAKCSETTVEIKIKTLDNQTYTLRVDKCVPVPALKEQIATVTGVLSEQQRLICRGKVLKDDQLLSAYHVEDGHTLHLVARQLVPHSMENAADHPESDASSSGHSHGSRVGASVLVGSFNIPEQGEGMPDLGRIVSTVLSSFGITSFGNGSEETNLNESGRERATFFSLSGQRNSNRQQPDQAGTGNQSSPNSSTASLPNVAPESLQPPVIPDSLTTLSQYLTHLRQEFDTTVSRLNNTSQAAEPHAVNGQGSHAASRSSGPAGLPTPASLAEVLMSTRQLLNEQTAECLLQLAREMENQANVTDPSERTRIQTYALRSGAHLQNLGSLLLELGRTTMTLRMGQTSGDAVVNAGPAIFISQAGPSPIMVQPQPFQPGTSLGAIPLGTVQHSSGFTGGSVSSGLLPRNIDIRIRTARDRRDSTSSQNQEQTVQPTSDNNISTHQAAAEGTGPSLGREPEVQVLPIRTLSSGAPTSTPHAASDSSGRSLGIFFPVLARVQHVTSRNSNNTRASQVFDQNLAHNVDNGGSSMPNSAASGENTVTPDLNVGGATNGQGFPVQIPDGLNQLLRSIISGEHPHRGNTPSQSMGTGSVDVHNAVAEGANGPPEATPQVSEEGLLISNILRQIMPRISESIATPSNSPSASGENAEQDRTAQASAQAPTNPEQGRPRRSSRQRHDPSSQASPPKRQKRE